MSFCTVISDLIPILFQYDFQFTKLHIHLKIFIFFFLLLFSTKLDIIIADPVSSLTHSPSREYDSLSHPLINSFYPPWPCSDPVLYEALSWSWSLSNSHTPDLAFN